MLETSGITVCIVAWNAAENVEATLRTLQQWTDRIIVIDDEITDETVEIAQRCGALVLSVSPSLDFATVRSMALEYALGDWFFCLQANERMPEQLGPILKRLLQEHGNGFAAMAIPVRTSFCGMGMEHGGWEPEYGRPQLLKRGAFQFVAAEGWDVEVQGVIVRFPADDPKLAIIRDSYPTIQDYQESLDGYSEEEADRQEAEGGAHSWQAMLAHFTQDWQTFYETERGALDGMHGFVAAFMAAYARFSARARLWERRSRVGEQDTPALPSTVPEMLEFMAHVCREGAEPWQTVAPTREPVAVQRERMVYVAGERWWDREAGARFLRLCEALGEPPAVVEKDNRLGAYPEAEGARTVSADTIAAVRITEAGTARFRPQDDALVQVVRVHFPTDRLPEGWSAALNAADRVWVASEFNRGTFVRGGVAREKIVVLPDPLDPVLFALAPAPSAPDAAVPFTFLACLEWEEAAGWDVLLEAFANTFSPEENVHLRMQIAPSERLTAAEIRKQATDHLSRRTGQALEALPHLHLHFAPLSFAERLTLYGEAQAAVFPFRGEGTGRLLLEAMAAGLPTIATAWSSVTEFYNRQVGYPLQCRVVPIAEETVRLQPYYAGHWWAEPNQQDLQRQMRALVSHRDEAQKRGQAARALVRDRFSPETIAPRLGAELALCQTLAAERAAILPEPTPTPTAPAVPVRLPAHPVPVDPLPSIDLEAGLGRRLRLRWQTGATDRITANLREALFTHLRSAGDIDLVVNANADGAEAGEESEPPTDATDFDGASPDVTVVERFAAARTAQEGKYVLWPSYPEMLCFMEGEVRFSASAFDEIWTSTRWVRDTFVRRGVPAEKVRIVPAGVATDQFTQEGVSHALETEATTRFLFVGPLLARSGGDLLLQAYLETFRREDDVFLLIVETDTDVPEAERLRALCQRAQADPQAPRLFLAPSDPSEEELTALYRSATCLVSPMRNEPVALHVLQGMAGALTPIVTAGGATDDYLDDVLALRVPSYPWRSHRKEGAPSGPHPEGYEPDLDALRQALRWVAQSPEAARERGASARAQILNGWTPERSTGMLRERLRALTTPPFPQTAPPAKRWMPRRKKGEAVAPKTPQSRRPQPIELSLCMIVRNEEARIRYCLESIAPYVDEMIVVDTGSTDRTREIASECGARVFDFPWTESFAEARNQSLALAQGEWIFWMDADDVIPPECGAQLRTLIQRDPAKTTAYQVQVRIPPGPKEFSMSVVDHVKLFPNRPELRFEHRIHEQIMPALRREGLEILFSDAYVVHQHYDRTDAGQALKRQRDFRLLELDLKERPEHPFVLFNLGMTYLYATKEFEVAAQYLRRSLDASDWRASIVRKTYALLTTARICQQDWQAALIANEEGRKYYPEDAELLFQAGQIYANLGRHAEAREAFERLIAGQDDPHYRSVDIGLRTYRGRHELALHHRRTGEMQDCLRILQELAERYPDYIPARLDLVETLYGIQQEALARTHLAAIPRTNAMEPTLRALYMQMGLDWPAAEAS